MDDTPEVTAAELEVAPAPTLEAAAAEVEEAGAELVAAAAELEEALATTSVPLVIEHMDGVPGPGEPPPPTEGSDELPPEMFALVAPPDEFVVRELLSAPIEPIRLEEMDAVFARDERARPTSRTVLADGSVTFELRVVEPCEVPGSNGSRRRLCVGDSIADLPEPVRQDLFLRGLAMLVEV